MNYALGCAFNLKELFNFLDFKKLKLSTATSMKLVGSRHKELVACKIMAYCVKLVIDDIIHNNATFSLPTHKRKAFIKMKKVEEENFVKGRRKGKWSDVDFLMSDFSGYQMTLFYMSGSVMKYKSVYVDPKRKKLITEYTNNGKQYF